MSRSQNKCVGDQRSSTQCLLEVGLRSLNSSVPCELVGLGQLSVDDASVGWDEFGVGSGHKCGRKNKNSALHIVSECD